MKAHVICCNDKPMYVVLGDEEKARLKTEELLESDYSNYKSPFNRYSYDDSHLWSIHTVEAE